MQLKQDTFAPDFQAENQNGETKKLSDYQGNWLVLYFYPGDFTPGCTMEACNFRDEYDRLKNMANVVGISADPADRHKKFQAKFRLPFELLSDAGSRIAKLYGAAGKIMKKRITFLIDPRGIIRKIYKSVNPAEHAGQVISDLRELKK